MGADAKISGVLVAQLAEIRVVHAINDLCLERIVHAVVVLEDASGFVVG
jgi:hypothetical protein